MELNEIIKSSLSIFSIATSIILIVSYIIFKLRDRARKKTLFSVNVQVNKSEDQLEERQGNVLIKLPIQSRFNITNEDRTSDELNYREFKYETPSQTLNYKDDNKYLNNFSDEKLNRLKFVIK